MNVTPAVASPWTLGDFHVIGAAQTIVGERLCDDSALTAGHRVLDVACGSGNTALAAARRGNFVTGIDIVDKLIDRARLRAQAEGFAIDFLVGDAQKLPFEDNSFDYVLSSFGVMFAPDQERAADEMLRLCKPGGTIAMANWTVESLVAGLFAIGAKYAPPPVPPAHRPIEWGTVPGLQRLFGGKYSKIRLVDRCTYARFLNVDQMIATFKQYFGPMIDLYARAPEHLHEQIDEELRQLIGRYNRAMDGTLAAALSYVNVILTKT